MQIAKEGKTKKKDGNLKRWINEDWRNLTPYAEGLVKSLKDTPECGKPHPEQKGKSICRPLKKINESTPKTADNYSIKELQKAVEIKNKGKIIKWDDLYGMEGGFRAVILRPLICRIGSKMRYINDILKLIPEHITYVEPFVGSGAVLVSKEPSQKEIINDLDDELIKDWKLLKTTKYQGEHNNVNTLEKLQSFINKNLNSSNKFNKLSARLAYRCALFSGVDDPTYKSKIYRYSNINSKMKILPEYNKRLKNVKIYNEDYKNIIKKYDSKNTFFFLDPPYENTKGLYTNESFNFEELRDILSKIKGKFLLTLNYSQNIKTLFKNYNQKTIHLKSVGGIAIGKNPRKELMIWNYPAPNKSGSGISGGANYQALQGLGYALGDDDIKNALPDINIIDYEQLKNYNSIDELLPNNGDSVIILYEHEQNSGHWVCVSKINDTIEFFCSYGTPPDHQLKWVDYNTRKELGSDIPLLSKMFDATDKDVIYNDVKYQNEDRNIATCGKYVVVRIKALRKGLTLQQFEDFLKSSKPKNSSYDEYINQLFLNLEK